MKRCINHELIYSQISKIVKPRNTMSIRRHPQTMRALVYAAGLAYSHSAREVPDFGSDFSPTQNENMNGEYALASTPGGKPGLFPKHFKDYPGGVESYDVYSPAITTRYSQVETIV